MICDWYTISGVILIISVLILFIVMQMVHAHGLTKSNQKMRRYVMKRDKQGWDMDKDQKLELVKSGLKFCPECAKALEEHPNVPDVMSCFVHGDFLMLWVEGDIHVRWRPLRLAPTYDKR